MGITLVVVAVLVLDAVALARAGTTAFEGDPPGWLRTIGWIVAASGLLLEIGGLVVLFRANRRNRDAPLRVMSVERGRELARVVRRGGPASADDLPLLRYTAEQAVGQTRLAWSQAGITLLLAGQALLHFGWLWWAFAAPFTVLFCVAWWWLFRDARLADAFLRAHPAPAPSPPAPAG
ncbi:hypothetical protein ACFY3U_15305 [Micromonospora sp. NPDC000089]|uniref:hypothetical protein n=1 Tax=unclassified Micromonospora TaxID=2617518 RepID=UPI0036B4525E